MKVLTVVGTRPNFTKEYAMGRALKKVDIEEVLVHTGQHYDYEMSQSFFEGLDLPKPSYLNEIIKSGFHGDETAVMLSFLEQVLLRERPDVTLVYGDVNSTLAAALASVKLKIPVAHVEAGLRCEYFYNPEEVNRRLTDAMSELLFPHIRSAYNSLILENYPVEKVVLAGDIVMDSLLLVASEKNIQVSDEGYILMTMHRAENTGSPKRMKNILEGVIESRTQVRFLMHPRTRNALVNASLMDRIDKAKNIDVSGPASFVEFVKLLAGASRVVTDSGGVRREAYVFKKPVINISELIWVPEMVEAGWSISVRDDKEKIRDKIINFQPPKEYPSIFGDGKAADIIARELLKRYG
jgi:UDP-N-acetylglucosamine 2-epimerase|tara:strand:+ start:452 stop:1510 length:1059 start_codon:yes stop_codon:yes gene_type:complete